MSSSPVTLSDAAIDDIQCAAQHPVSKQWVTGNGLGQVNTCFSDDTITLGDAAITALAFNPLGTELAVAHEGEVKIHDGKEYGRVLVHAAARFAMNVTQLQYSNSGHHM